MVFLGMMALQSRGYGALPGINGVLEFVWNYYEITLAAIMWLLVLRSISRGARTGQIPGFSPVSASTAAGVSPGSPESGAGAAALPNIRSRPA